MRETDNSDCRTTSGNGIWDVFGFGASSLSVGSIYLTATKQFLFVRLLSAVLGRIVVQVWTKPSLDFGDAHPLTLVVVGHLVAVDFAETEIP